MYWKPNQWENPLVDVLLPSQITLYQVCASVRYKSQYHYSEDWFHTDQKLIPILIHSTSQKIKEKDILQ